MSKASKRNVLLNAKKAKDLAEYKVGFQLPSATVLKKGNRVRLYLGGYTLCSNGFENLFKDDPQFSTCECKVIRHDQSYQQSYSVDLWKIAYSVIEFIKLQRKYIYQMSRVNLERINALLDTATFSIEYVNDESRVASEIIEILKNC